jgi:hypothetical protein
LSSCGREHAPSSLAYKGGQYSINDSLQPFTTQSTKHATPIIVDTLLTLIFRMGQGACCYFFGLQRRSILHLYQSATIHDSNYQRCMTKIVGAPLTLIFTMRQGACHYILACNGNQYSIYDSLQPFTNLITNDVKRNIVDAPLMLILMYCLVNVC